MKTVGFLTPEYPLPSMGYTGGIGTSIKNLADFYENQGLRVFIFVYGQREDRLVEQKGKTFVLIKQLYAGSMGWLVNRFRIQKVVNQWVSKARIDMIEVPDWTGISAFIRFDCLTVLKLHGSDTFFCHMEGRQVKSRNLWFEKTAFKNADHVVAVSDFVGKKTCELFGIFRSYDVIHNGVYFRSLEPKKENPRAAAKTVFYFGSLIRKKGVLEIPAIYNIVHQKHPNIRLVLAGNDAFDIHTGSSSTWELMKKDFSAAALPSVEYLGLVKHEQIDQLIQQADVCIFPSYAEAFPVSWLEAMAQGKALVCSDIGWSPEVILSDEVGLTANPADHETYADHVVGLLENDQLRENMGKSASACVEENFSIERAGFRHLDLLSQKIKKRK